jgi:ubiquinone/menaquinone biosynthesis C-methylase UbiE
VYDADVRREWDRLDRHRTEFAVTLRALRDYLPVPPATLLDVGGGPGRYSLALASQGYSVTLFDLSSGLLDFARVKAQEAHIPIAAYEHGDARDLGRFASGAFDAVLLMGPLYHLPEVYDRHKTSAEAFRVLKPGGVIFAAFIGRYAPVRWAAKHSPAWIMEQGITIEMLAPTGHQMMPPGATFTNLYTARLSEVEPLMTGVGFKTLEILAAEGLVSMIEEQVNNVTGELWEAWVELNYHAGKDPSLLGAAEHILYIGRR